MMFFLAVKQTRITCLPMLLIKSRDICCIPILIVLQVEFVQSAGLAVLAGLGSLKSFCLEEANASNGPSQNPLHILNTPLSPIHLGLSGKHNSSTNLIASSSSSFVPNYHAAFRVVEVHQNRPNRLYYCGIVSLLVFPILSDTVTTVRRHSRSRG